MNDRDWYERIGQTLREQRRKRGWTIYDVAAITGSSGTAVSQWERAKRRMRAHAFVLLQEEGLLP